MKPKRTQGAMNLQPSSLHAIRVMLEESYLQADEALHRSELFACREHTRENLERFLSELLKTEQASEDDRKAAHAALKRWRIVV